MDQQIALALTQSLMLASIGQDSIGFGDALVLTLITNAFTLDPDLDPSTLIQPTVAGLTPQVIPHALRVSGRDPDTGDDLLIIPATTAGNTFQATTPTGLPLTIYGAALGSSTVSISGNFINIVQFETPVTINNMADVLTVPIMQIRLPKGSLQ